MIAVPAHVPRERVRDIDIYALDGAPDEHQRSLKVLHPADGARLYWTPRNGGHWVVTRSDLIERVLTDHTHFSSRYVTVPACHNPDPPIAPLQLDPPENGKYRALLAGAMSARAATGLGTSIAPLAQELAAGLRAHGRCEFIGQFARHLPIATFLHMCGLPAADRDRLVAIAALQLDPEVPAARAEGYRRMGQYLMQHIQARRAAPRDDLISELIAARIDGQPLGDYRLFGLINMLLIAGLDTVSSSLGAIARFLAGHPEHQAQLRANPKLIARAVEELLRRFPMFTAARVATRDALCEGAWIKAGDMVVAPTALYGLDDERFPDPLTVDFTRSGARHASFGLGAHQCPGATLARVELRVFLETWLTRMPPFALDPDGAVRLGAGPVASMLSLPLVWQADEFTFNHPKE